jgi:hypothetical protein
MRKVLAIFLLTASTVAMADGHGYYRGYNHGYWSHGHGGNWNWVAPVVVGGVIGYELARPQPVIVQQLPPPVVYQQQAQYCSPWTEIQNPDGTITRTRTCSQ